MLTEEILAMRLHNQHLAKQVHTQAGDVVTQLCAVQAQDYFGAKWSLGLRLKKAVDADIEKAFNRGEILRTHVMRPTWHFVAPQDIRWLLALTAPNVHALSAYYYRKEGLTDTVFAKCRKVIEKELAGGKYLTREEMKDALAKAGIAAVGLSLAYIMMWAELEAVVCSGPRRGNQFTYALLEERVPKAAIPKGDEALAQFALRYFTGHGPATVHDFAKWGGLRITDARRATNLAGAQLERAVCDKLEYFFIPGQGMTINAIRGTYILPTYDEYIIGYKGGKLLFDAKRPGKMRFDSTIIGEGKIKGSWRRMIKNNTTVFELAMFEGGTKTERQLIEKACRGYAKFTGTIAAF